MSKVVPTCSLFAVDCIVVCCCCPCLLLKVTVYLFIRLPCRIAVKCKRVVLKGLRKDPKKHDDVGVRYIKDCGGREEASGAQAGYDSVEGHCWHGDCRSSFFSAEKVLEEILIAGGGDKSSFVEAEKVWEDLIAEQGLFWFGSFWGMEDSSSKHVNV